MHLYCINSTNGQAEDYIIASNYSNQLFECPAVYDQMIIIIECLNNTDSTETNNFKFKYSLISSET